MHGNDRQVGGQGPRLALTNFYVLGVTMGKFLCRLLSVIVLAGAVVNFSMVFSSSPAFNSDERLQSLDGDWRVSNMAAHYDKAEYLLELARTYLSDFDRPDDLGQAEGTPSVMQEPGARIRTALALLNQSVRLDPANASSWAYLAQAQGRFYNFGAMRDSLQRSWDLAPNDVQLAQLRLELLKQIYQAHLEPPEADMTLEFGKGTLVPGTYAVRLFMANSFDDTGAPGQRQFDVLVEDQLFLDDVDLVSSFGNLTGGMFEWVGEVEDGTIDIDFARSKSDPLINGVEIIQLSTSSIDIVSETLNTGEALEEAPVGGQVVYRWSAGKFTVATVDDGADWSADASVVVSGPIQIYARRITDLDSSIPEDTTPLALFTEERFPPSAGEVPALSTKEMSAALRDVRILAAHAPSVLEDTLPNSNPVRTLLDDLETISSGS